MNEPNLRMTFAIAAFADAKNIDILMRDRFPFAVLCC